MDSIIAYSPKKARWPALEETTSKCKQFMSFHSPGSGQCEGYFFFDHAQELAMDIRTLDYVRGAIKSIWLPLVVFLEDRGKNIKKYNKKF